MARDYKKEFKGQCLTCEHYDVCDTYEATRKGYRCTRLYYVTAPDDKCYRYGDACRSNDALDKYFKQLKSWGYTGYYVTSSICTIITSSVAIDYLTNNYIADLENRGYLVSQTTGTIRKNYQQIMNEKAMRYLNAFETFYSFFEEYPMGQNFIDFYEFDGPRMQAFILGSFNNNSEEGLSVQKAILDYTFTAIVPLLDSFTTMIEYGNHQGALKKYIQLMNKFAEFMNINIQNFNSKTGKVEQQKPLVRTRTLPNNQ